MTRMATSAVMSLRELGRQHTMLVLAALVPAISYAVAVASTRDAPVPVLLAAAAATEPLMVSERVQSLLYLGIAAVGLMGAFFGATLVQRRIDVNRRLVLCGYHPAELMLAKLAVLVVIIAVSATYALAVLLLIQDVGRPLGVLVGFGLAAFVYGAYGLVIGSIFRRDLETIFAIVLLINLDAGWLQNPIYFLNVRSPWLVESLPGHLPAQTAFLAALTADPLAPVAVKAWLYGTAFLVIALVLYARRMRIVR